jgi:cell division protein FtsW
MKNAAIILQNWLITFKKRNFEGADFFLFGLVFALICFGLLMVYSASFIYAEERSGDGLFFIKKQIIYALIGFAALFLTSLIHYKNWLKFSYPIFIFATLLLLLVLVEGVGVRSGGAQRWIEVLGFRFQPAEFFKFSVIIFVASRLIKKEDRLNRFQASILGTALLLAPAFVMLLMQPDLGTIILTSGALFIMLFIGGVPIRFLALSLMSFLPLIAYLIFITPYRFARITSFMNPWQDPSGSGFQVIQSLVGVSNGQIMGVGLGNGKEKLFFLPEAHNDFIFAVISEELGFIGVAVLLFAFSLIITRGFRIASQHFKNNEKFGFLLAIGLTLMISLQAFVNMGVVFGIVPTKGLTLPFLSYGGSSLIINCIAIGILMNLSKVKLNAKTA